MILWGYSGLVVLVRDGVRCKWDLEVGRADDGSCDDRPHGNSWKSSLLMGERIS